MPTKKAPPTEKKGTEPRIKLDPKAQEANAKIAKKLAREASWPTRKT